MPAPSGAKASAAARKPRASTGGFRAGQRAAASRRARAAVVARHVASAPRLCCVHVKTRLPQPAAAAAAPATHPPSRCAARRGARAAATQPRRAGPAAVGRGYGGASSGARARRRCAYRCACSCALQRQRLARCEAARLAAPAGRRVVRGRARAAAAAVRARARKRAAPCSALPSACRREAQLASARMHTHTAGARSRAHVLSGGAGGARNRTQKMLYSHYL